MGFSKEFVLESGCVGLGYRLAVRGFVELLLKTQRTTPTSISLQYLGKGGYTSILI